MFSKTRHLQNGEPFLQSLGVPMKIRQRWNSTRFGFTDPLVSGLWLAMMKIHVVDVGDVLAMMKDWILIVVPI